MYQGVIAQCSGVAHNSRFSEFSQSAESIPFMFQYLHLWGIISIPILMHMGHLPSHIFSQLFSALYEAFTIPYIFNGALTLPIVGCFCCTLHLPIPMECINSHGVPFHPVSSWGTLPSHLIIF